ncbi:hypothetical protein ABID70_000143 [Clavibacter michiganensis]|uniref:DUF5819 family protein n=1 Tax=Clavibacter michiganensis TaxID=28447 RepID=UPI001AE68611|nr:DUF5819 family protein [Clavibacter michiganensis]MBP2457582.1 hypothetical protein [Clavibacter michiganensis]MDQ0410152.1 hypothetical protein [Clavibacter michiganensis]
MTDTTHPHDTEAHADLGDPHGDPPTATRASPARLTRGARIGAAVAALVVAIYVATTILMVIPQSSTTRALTAPARPYFGQQWNVFAPSIQKTNRHLEMQAQWRDDSGALVKSEWLDITAAEYESGDGHVQPSRTNKQSANLLKAYSTRYQALTEEQRRVVQDTFIRRTDSGFAAKTPASLVEQLTGLADGTQGRVVSFLRYDYVMKEFATYWGTAYFGREVERVRWRVVTTRPNDYEHRLDEERQFTASARTYGWRQVDDVIDPQALSVYQAVVERYAR